MKYYVHLSKTTEKPIKLSLRDVFGTFWQEAETNGGEGLQ